MKYYISLVAFVFVITSGILVTQPVSAFEYQGRLIKIGTIGNDVQELQECLLNMGFALPVYGADGYYGQETYRQITSYQIANNLIIDGIVGPQTADSLSCGDEIDDHQKTVELVPIQDVDYNNGSREINLEIEGYLPDGCSELLDHRIVFNDTAIDIFVEQEVTTGIDCNTAVTSFEKELAINKEDLDEGDYIIKVNNDHAYIFTIENEDNQPESTIPASTTQNVSIEEKTLYRDGADNDGAEFIYTFGLRSFGNESYISENAQESIDFSIIDSSSGTIVYDSDGVTQNGSVVASLSSQESIEDGYYRINEDEYGTFEFILSYDPPSGTGSYRVQLDSINYRPGSPSGDDKQYRTSELSSFRSNSVNIID